jgi:hypothetical protein
MIRSWRRIPRLILNRMPRYHVAFYLPHAPGEMVVAEALVFPGALTQGSIFRDARLMIATAVEDIAQLLLEEGRRFRRRPMTRTAQMPT